MKRRHAFLIGVVILLLMLCIGCGSGGSGAALTPEQQRLQKIALIDTTTLQTLVRLEIS